MDTLTCRPPTPLGHRGHRAIYCYCTGHQRYTLLSCKLATFIVAARPMRWLVLSGALALQLKVFYRLIDLSQLSQVSQLILRLLFLMAAASPGRPALDDRGPLCCHVAPGPGTAAAGAALPAAPGLPQGVPAPAPALAAVPSVPTTVTSHGGAC